MAKTHGEQSRLLVKVANGIEKFGFSKFEKKLDSVLEENTVPVSESDSSKEEKTPSKRNIYTKKSHHAVIHPIVKAICKELLIHTEDVRRFVKADEVRFAQSLCVYFIKLNTSLAHKVIANYFKRNSHSFVNDCMEIISEHKGNNARDQQKHKLIKEMESVINELQKGK